jgi:hypothetical protein
MLNPGNPTWCSRLQRCFSSEGDIKQDIRANLPSDVNTGVGLGWVGKTKRSTGWLIPFGNFKREDK